MPLKGLSWRKGKQIGQGSYGSVFKAQDLDRGLIFAVKQCPQADPKHVEKMKMEIEICRTLQHPNIVRYLGFEDSSGGLFVFLEYVAGGCMSNILHEFGALTSATLRKATRDCCRGLLYLHTRNPPVVHRDIKASNLLVDSDFEVKLADFGCSKKDDCTKSFTTIGSVPWMAPEVILNKEGHGRKADIWSFGCTVVEMATAEQPWGANRFNSVMFALRHIGMTDEVPTLPNDYQDEECRDFVRQCVVRCPETRPRSRHLLTHKFLR